MDTYESPLMGDLLLTVVVMQNNFTSFHVQVRKRDTLAGLAVKYNIAVSSFSLILVMSIMGQSLIDRSID